MDKDYDALNEFLDKCINDTLRETSGRFQVNSNAHVDEEDVHGSEGGRFKGFKEAESDDENMKDFETSVPYKVYRRPMSAQEMAKYRDYERDKSKRKHGKGTRHWDGLDDSERGEDITEEFMGKTDKKGKKKNAESEMKSTRDSQTYEIKDPLINHEVYYPKKSTDGNSLKDRWTNIKALKEKTGFQQTGESIREKPKQDSAPESFKHETNASDQNQQDQTAAEIVKNAQCEPGKMTEEVKQELLKLRPEVLDRSSWGALPPMGEVPRMVPPADTLVFTLSTGTPPCHTGDACRRTVRELQARHMGKGLADIQYNFLVGGDGNLYEGRGWGYESGISKDKQQGKSYNIAFIGDFQGDVEKIPSQMLGPVQSLIIWGSAIRLLTRDVKNAGEYKIPSPEQK